MARIEVDPNYSSPTFSRATAATDPFKKEDVQLVAAAMSTHDHSSGKGLAVIRLGPLNQDVTFTTNPAKIVASNLIIQDPTGGTTLQLMSAGSATTSLIEVWPTSSLINTTAGQFQMSTSELAITTSAVGSGAPKPINFYVAGASRMYIDVSGAVYINTLAVTTTLNVTGAVSGSTFTATGSYFYAPDTNHMFAGGGGTMYARSANGLSVQHVDTSPAPLACSNINLMGQQSAVAARLIFPTSVEPKILLYDLGSGSFAGWGIAGGEFYTCVGPFAYNWRGGLPSSAIIAQLGSGGAFYNVSDMSGHAPAIQSGGYAFSAQNIANSNGQVIAQAHPVYACVDHARENGLSVAEIPTPTAKVLALQPYAYDHMHLVRLQQGEALTPMTQDNGDLVATPTYGFAASEVYATIPEAAALDEDGTPIGVDSYRLLCVLWSSVQDLLARMEAVEAPKAA